MIVSIVVVIGEEKLTAAALWLSAMDSATIPLDWDDAHSRCLSSHTYIHR